MPDPRDGQATEHRTEKEPQERAFRQESPDREPAERDPAADPGHYAPAAGEASDVTDDHLQEQGEDTSASEEEGVTATMRLTAAPGAPPLAPPGPIGSATPASQQEHEAGESPDAIQDSTQFGQDNMADRAEERALRQEDSQQHQAR